MAILLVGTSYRIADTAWRSRLAFAPADLTAWLQDTVRDPAIAQLFVLSTCNRVEVYAATTDIGTAGIALRQAIVRHTGDDLFGPGPHCYLLAGGAAARHLCRVACGLDSMLVGEAEVLGQLRAARDIAIDAGTVGREIDALLSAALTAGRRARTETSISVGALSAAGAAVALAEKRLGSLAGRDALVIGAGHAARLALMRLAKRRPRALIVANRSREHAEALAARVGADVQPLDAVPRILCQVDVAIAATQSPAVIVTTEGLRSIMTSDSARRLAIVDLGIPPNIEPGVGSLPGVTLDGLDDLRAITDETAQRRQLEIPRVEAIAAEAAATLSILTGRDDDARPGLRGRGRATSAWLAQEPDPETRESLHRRSSAANEY
jgi:glutamyl-tRNA reductase